MNKPILNIAIVAHVDAGKTTLTENLLYHVGAIRTRGSVDAGSTVTDVLDIEKQRGISVRTAATSFEFEGTIFNLIDTPGHADFSAEVERCLSILNGAILVVSAVEGVQAHTYSLWEALQSLKIPTIIVVNKIDRSGSDYLNVLEELEKELKTKIIPLNIGLSEGESNIELGELWNTNKLSNDANDIRNKALENIAELDEQILEKYFNGEEISDVEIVNKAVSLTQKSKLNPVIALVAKENIGTEFLLQTIKQFIPTEQEFELEEVSALVFKIEHDNTLGRLAYIKLFSGHIKCRDLIYNYSIGKEEKVAQIKKTYTSKMRDIPELRSGDVAIISGMQNVMAGHILGKPHRIPKNTTIQHPVLTTQIKAEKLEQYAQLAEALKVLNIEDPLLDFIWFKEEKEMHLKLMGKMQMEILKSTIDSRFGISANFENPSVIYKETPISKAEGFAKYTMPKPCWAVLTFLIEPSETGSGLSYNSKVSVDKIHRKYQNEIEETIPKVLQQGIKGWELTDVKITLIGGEDHEVHSRSGDFILATPMAILAGLEKAGTSLLEPVYEFEIKAQEELLGSITNDLTTMRAIFGNPEFSDGKFTLTGKVPVATAINYSIKLGSITSGKGKLKLSFGGYQKCTDRQGVVREYKGVSPLNQSQWILHKRGAFKAEERKF